jgi:peroxiredoxin
VGDDRHLVFRQKLLGEEERVKQGVVMVKQPGLFSPTFGAMSLHVFTQSPQNFIVEPGIHSLACLDRCFALPHLLYR